MVSINESRQLRRCHVIAVVVPLMGVAITAGSYFVASQFPGMTVGEELKAMTLVNGLFGAGGAGVAILFLQPAPARRAAKALAWSLGALLIYALLVWPSVLVALGISFILRGGLSQ